MHLRSIWWVKINECVWRLYRACVAAGQRARFSVELNSELRENRFLSQASPQQPQQQPQQQQPQQQQQLRGNRRRNPTKEGWNYRRNGVRIAAAAAAARAQQQQPPAGDQQQQQGTTSYISNLRLLITCVLCSISCIPFPAHTANNTHSSNSSCSANAGDEIE